MDSLLYMIHRSADYIDSLMDCLWHDRRRCNRTWSVFIYTDIQMPNVLEWSLKYQNMLISGNNYMLILSNTNVLFDKHINIYHQMKSELNVKYKTVRRCIVFCVTPVNKRFKWTFYIYPFHLYFNIYFSCKFHNTETWLLCYSKTEPLLYPCFQLFL